MEACELLAIEVRIDRIEAELAAELPPHLRAFARAHAHGFPAPPAPEVLRRATTLATARAALVYPVLADRGLALLRLAAPVAIEADPAVTAARSAAPTWAALSALAAARDAAAAARFGRRAIDVMHRLHGSAASLAIAGRALPDAPVEPASLAIAGRALPDAPVEPASLAIAGRAVPVTGTRVSSGEPGARVSSGEPGARVSSGEPGARVASGEPEVGTQLAAPRGHDAGARGGALPPAVPGWFAPDGVEVDDRAIARAWDELRARHGVDGAVRFERAVGVRPRAFVVEPGREVVIAIPPRVATPAERFAVLHELGHAVAAFARPGGLPRVVDEAAAAYVARAIECATDPWHSPAAGAARARRLVLAQVLDRIERALPELPGRPEISERPPWALWHDPGVQAAYVAAESLADAIAYAIEQGIGASPAPGALAGALAAWSEPIDRLGTVSHAI